MHSQVEKVAVVGLPDDRFGEAIVAFLELADRGVIDERLFKSWLRQQKLPPHKMPDYFFAVGDFEGAIERLPINTSGKVLKTELRSFARGLISMKG